MTRRLLSILIFVLCAGWLLADDIKTVSTTYEYVSDNPNESPEQAETRAKERAKMKAMEEHFGLDVSSVTSILERNKQGGGQVSSSSDVFALRETSVRGEWIETIEENVLDKKYEHNFWHVKVYVKGRARNKSKEKVEIKYALINNTHDRVNRDQYYDGDDIFLRFSTPVSGSLCVYLVDEEKEVYCLLPYQSVTTGCQHVEANTDYLFFYAETDPDADEYTLNTARSQEQNAVYIIYTPNTLTKANDQKAGTNWRNEQLPRQLRYDDFVRWLNKNQTKDEDMVVRTEVITIRK